MTPTKVDVLTIDGTTKRAQNVYDVWYRPDVGAQKCFAAVLAGEHYVYANVKAVASTIVKLKGKLRTVLNEGHFEPKKQERIIEVRCGGPFVYDVEVVRNNEPKRFKCQLDVKTLKPFHDPAWLVKSNPRHCAAANVHEVPYTAARFTKIAYFMSIKEAMSDVDLVLHTDFDDFAYDRVKKKVNQRHEIDVKKLDALNVDTLVKDYIKFLADATAEEVHKVCRKVKK